MVKVNVSNASSQSSQDNSCVGDAKADQCKEPDGGERTEEKSTLNGSPRHNSVKSLSVEASSLNDDLLSVVSSSKLRYGAAATVGRSTSVTRPSFESFSLRPSLDPSSVFIAGARNNISTMLDIETASPTGSGVNYSPLGQNSIFEIVMNTRRKGWLRAPTVQDIPPVPLSKDMPEGDWKTRLGSYVSRISDGYTTFQNTNTLASMNRSHQLKKLERYDRTESAVSADEEDTEEDAFSSSKMLEDIPSVYFNEDFQLDNPRVFHKVVEDINLQLDSLTIASQSQRAAAYKDLQERLNFYLDTIENILIVDISKSSHKFLDALEDVGTIKDEAQSVLTKLDQLKTELETEDRERLQKRLRLSQKLTRIRNIERLEQGLLQLHVVLKQIEECRRLYDAGEYTPCLKHITSVELLISGNIGNDELAQEWTHGWPYSLQDLSRIPSLAPKREYLSNVRIEIGGKLSLALVDLLLSDLRAYATNQTVKGTLNRLQSQTKGGRTYWDIELAFREKVTDIIQRLIKCEELTSAFQLYQDKFIVELKSIIKKHLPKDQPSSENSLNDGDSVAEPTRPPTPSNTGTASTGSKLSRLIREQTPAEFQEMLTNIITEESNALRRLSRHQKLLLDVSLTELASDSSQYDMIMLLDIRRSINEGIRIIQLRLGKVIAVRRDFTSQLPPRQFIRFYMVCALFIQECESLSGDLLTKYLADVLMMQVRNYISTFAMSNMEQLQHSIDSDRWIPYIVDTTDQSDVNDIVSCTDIDPLNWVHARDLAIESSPAASPSPPVSQSSSLTSPSAPSPSFTSTTGHKRSVVVGDKTFVASESLIICLRMLSALLLLSLNLPSNHLSLLEKAVLDLLRCFNIRAMSSAASTNDKKPSSATKNLSIMGESLDCLSEMIGLVQGFYQRLEALHKDFQALPPHTYAVLAQQFRRSSDKLYQAHAPPPPPI
ncbi:ABL093Wp [Eremothecium gossypii ATCC 10895]|uniref:ABL093Wp n=1 Tax=Eremothecium gossypii (strain ATCC 10895 / CBS 109.51 / FGSC 9923 / NRRL Y-1056) TaxID=284811 RepID=Q75DW6_EREGS|nr:ABL093Wp [Eremothecium gossypii ATCC 10895]AAS50678.2 ABL093Wp [Eremothecium gossypii ATCC 10895]